MLAGRWRRDRLRPDLCCGFARLWTCHFDQEFFWDFRVSCKEAAVVHVRITVQ